MRFHGCATLTRRQLWCGLLIAAACLGAEPRGRPVSPAVVNPIFRSTLRAWLCLDGEWDFALDPDEVGERRNGPLVKNPFR